MSASAWCLVPVVGTAFPAAVAGPPLLGKADEVAEAELGNGIGCVPLAVLPRGASATEVPDVSGPSDVRVADSDKASELDVMDAGFEDPDEAIVLCGLLA